MATKSNNHSNTQAAKEPLSKEAALDFIFNFFRAMGLFSIQIMRTIAKGFSRFHHQYLTHYTKRLDKFGLRMVKRFSKIYKAILYKFYMFLKFFVDAKNVVKNGYYSHPKASGIGKFFYAVAAFFKGVRNNSRIFITAVNYALPVVAFVVFMNLIGYVSSLNFAVSVNYNGEHIGFIENEAVFEQAETELQQRMIYMEDDETIDNIPQFTLAVVDVSELKTDSEVTDTIIKSSSGEIIQATGLSIDGQFYGAVKDGDLLQSKLDSLLDAYNTNGVDEQVSFAKDVKTNTGIFKAKNVVDEAALLEKITSLEQKEVYYEVVEGDTPIMIAAKNDMSLDELVVLNSDILTNCLIGKQVQINRSQAFLPVKVTRTETYSQAMPFETTYVESNKYFKGYSTTTKAGVKGEQSITAKVEYVDGSEVGREIMSTKVISQPTAAVVTKGTLEYKKVQAATSGKISNSGFIWPVWGGYISQYMGGRYGHNGIDYAYRGNGYGQPIVAAISGKVVYAGTNGTYGKLIKIQSPGGTETWYAHCSKLLVSVGQTVGQGEQIAKIGSTGRSTGNHLHFRVLVNGRQQNPMNYLP